MPACRLLPSVTVRTLDSSQQRSASGPARGRRLRRRVCSAENRETLEWLEVRSYVKTSGADGIHVLVPITRRSSYRDTYEFAERVSRRLEAENPGLVTTEWLKKRRGGARAGRAARRPVRTGAERRPGHRAGAPPDARGGLRVRGGASEVSARGAEITRDRSAYAMRILAQNPDEPR
jgi:LigD, primase-polymerase domain